MGPMTRPKVNAAAPATIVIVDDEPGIVDFVQLALRHEGFIVESAGDMAAGLQMIRRVHPDLAILDVGLPDGDGFELLRRLRAETDLPVVMLTARDEVGDRVRGLELGADDYMAKPFHIEELLARVRAHLRRRGVEAGEDRVLRFADLQLEAATRQVTRGGRPISLTAREFDLLELFMRNPNRVLSKGSILDRTWGYAFDDNLVEVYVGYLRRKLGEPSLIQTLRGAGYALRESQ